MKIDRERVRRMATAGYTAREIARELGISHTRVSQIIAQDGRMDVTASVTAQDSHTILIKTSDAVVTGVAIKRALERAGIVPRKSDTQD